METISHDVDCEEGQEMGASLGAWSEEDTSRARVFAARNLSENLRPSEFDPQVPLLEMHPATSRSHSVKVQERDSTVTSSLLESRSATSESDPVEAQVSDLTVAPSLLEPHSATQRSNSVKAQGPDPMVPSASCTWLPLTLCWPFLLVLFIIALTLGMVTILLSSYSAEKAGLCNNSGSAAFLFACRFLPTLVAVIYALMVTVLHNDVKRTDAFANLSTPEGASAASTLPRSGTHWWNDPVEALSKKKNNGRRSWTLFWTSTANIMAILLVSPLSAGVLYLDEVQISQDADFDRLEPFNNGPLRGPLELQNTSTDETYFRTISSVVQNLTTSAWLNDSYAVLPFWPADFDSVPFGASLAGAPQQWRGQTSGFQADLQCTPMVLTSRNNSDSTFIGLESADGCRVELNITVTALDWPPGGGWWSNTTATNYPTIANSGAPLITLNNTSECGGQEMFFVTNPSLQSPQTNQSLARLCSSYYFMASNVTATVENTATSSLVTIDEEGFNRTKIALDPSLIDLQNFEELFLDPGWSAYFQPPDGFNAVRPIFGGPLILLAATFGNPSSDIDSIVKGIGLLDQARRVKQRFFGEALQAAFVSTGKQNAQQISAQITTTQTRLVADYGVGITLGIILISSAAMVTFAYYCSRIQRRPLNLVRDPGSAAAMMLMLSRDANTRDCFRGFDKIPEDSMKAILGDTLFRVDDGRLFMKDDGKLKTSPSVYLN